MLAVIADPFGAALCLFLAGWFFARALRRSGALTIGDYFRMRYGRAAELISSLLQGPPFIAWAAAQFVAFGTTLQGLAGLDQTTAILVGGLVVLIYTTSGGMWAVSITDFVQGVVLIVGLAWLAPVAIADAGGWTAVSDALPAGSLDPLPQPTLHGWIWYLQAWAVVGLGSLPSQDLLQRTLSSRDEGVAARSAHLAGGLYLTVGMIPVALGLVAAVTLPGLEDPELALPELARAHLGPVGLAVFSGALLSAILSSADSALLAPAAVFAENIIRPLRPGMSDRAMLRLTRTLVAACSLLALALALSVQKVYELLLMSMEAGVAALIVPFAAGVYGKRVDERAACWSMAAGTLVWAVMTATQDLWPADLAGMAASATTLVAVARLRDTVRR